MTLNAIYLFYWVWLPHFVNNFSHFWLFLCKYSILEHQISECEWEKYEPLIAKSQKSGVSWVVKKWSGQAPLNVTVKTPPPHPDKKKPKTKNIRFILNLFGLHKYVILDTNIG